jgi:hypothetical protein
MTRGSFAVEAVAMQTRKPRRACFARMSFAGLLLACLLLCVAALAPAADAAEGPLAAAAPSISGIARDGQRLKAFRGAWSGQRPIVYSYRWLRCDASGNGCTQIASAAARTRLLAHEDVAHTLRVVVTAAGGGGETSATSAPSDLVAPAPLARRKAAQIAGSARDGQLLSVVPGSWKGTPPQSIAYQWQVCTSPSSCTAIPGAEASSYRAATAQLGKRLRVIVTATNDVGSLSVASRRTAKILAGAPVNTASPSVSGSLQEGAMLSADPGTWAGTGPISFAYQWLRCSILGGGCQQISGATEPTYTAEGLDLASNLAVVVTATNALGAVPATSPETQPIAGILPTSKALPSISGLLQDGGLLSVTSGSWSGTEPISYAYEWQLCNALGASCKAIEGASGSSLKLDPSEIGKTLDVVVTATNAAGSTSATSSLTGLIAGILPKSTALPSIGGLLKTGQLLSVTNGSWTGSEPISYSYRWQLCGVLGNSCTDIAKATGPTFLLGALDVGNTLRAVVTATNAAGSASAPTGVTGLIAGLL